MIYFHIYYVSANYLNFCLLYVLLNTDNDVHPLSFGWFFFFVHNLVTMVVHQNIVYEFRCVVSFCSAKKRFLERS